MLMCKRAAEMLGMKFKMKEKGDIYGSDIYERTTGIKIDRIDGTADGHFYDGEFTL